jgi:phage terminase small subunit
MTHRMVSFAHLVVGGKTQGEAYDIAYPTKARRSAKTTHEKASRLAADPRVQDLIAKLQEKATQATLFTLHDHLKNLHDISLKALAARDFNAASRAEEARGKAAGFYVQRMEHTGKDGGPIETKQTRDLTDEELAAALLAHGIEPRKAGVTH